MKKIITIVFLALLTQGSDVRSQWMQVVDPGEFFSPSGLAEIGGNLFSGTDAGVFYSTNDGINWVAGNSGLTNKNVSTIAVIGENIFTGCFGGGNDILSLSTNGGKDWSNVSEELPSGVAVDALGVSGGNLFAGLDGSYDPVYLTTNNGAAWIDASGTPITPWASTSVSSFAVNGNNIFTGLIYGGVMLSTDNGATWNSVSNGLPSGSYANISTLTMCNGYVFAGTGYGVFRSRDSGANWTAVNNGLTDTTVNDLISYNGNLFAGTNTGAYLSTNNGESWQNLNEEGKPEFNAQTLLVHDGYLFADSFSELWRRPLSDLNLSSVAEGAPAGSGLRVFPNPASGVVQIMGGQAGTVHLFDLMGRERMNGNDDGANTTLDVSNLEAGMYFLRLGGETARVVVQH
jgi:photosystem II stability/assembly factor-like uncharacterized protein